ncbi:type II toxin-antitoxin system PemK/MazF family toxin [Candidatus Peregrinibacteria bacterium]|nr:type II toxin-antitoxin system PemK/MazF family toxin [Candidatus Peregrinibacteria bacterium]
MKHGDIYWANLDPQKGSEQGGKRPVVIISGNTMNDNLGIVIICPISSKIKNYPACIKIVKNKLNNLEVDSEVITFQIRAISKLRFGRKIGVINRDQLRQILFGLNEIFTY